MMGGAVSGGVHETLSVSYSQEMKASRSLVFWFFFSSRRRHTRSIRDWSSDVCSSDLAPGDCGSCHRSHGAAFCPRRSLAGSTERAGQGGGLSIRLELLPLEDGRALEPVASLPEIGRASCRERWLVEEVAGRLVGKYRC